MADYSSWLQRAEAFVRSTSNLPGQSGINIAIEPPLGPQEVDGLHQVLPHGLPPLLRDFYSTASAQVELHYSWRPTGGHLERLREVFRYEYNVYGGVTFCAASAMVREQNALFDWADVFFEQQGAGPAAAAMLKECVPLIPIRNGDYVVEHMARSPTQPAILYVTHECDWGAESPFIPLARDAAEFMAKWEQLCYIGPEIWMLSPFLNASSTNLLDTKSQVARDWRSFLGTFSLAVP
ncbi:MAG TPA: hypothetical protein VGN12_23125 [Pirellulales bacterium]|jgi:hypothetical protein